MLTWLQNNKPQATQIKNYIKDLQGNCIAENFDFAFQAIEALESGVVGTFNEYLAFNGSYFSSIEENSPSFIFLEDIIPCFTTENNENGYHDITIYVDQPIPNSDEVNVGWGAGHTFVEITQGINGNVVRQFIGFYPVDDDVSPNRPNVLGGFYDDSGQEYDVSLRVEVNSTQFNAIIEYLNTLAQQSIDGQIEYDLNNFNCSDFGLDIINLTGITVPDSEGTWGGELGFDHGQGTCPALLGQDIRNTNFGPNVVKDLEGGVSLNSSENGDCE